MSANGRMIENYCLKEVLGEGQYGKVYKAINLKDNQPVAIKVVRAERIRSLPKLEEFTVNEIQTLARINHPNIVRFIEMLRTANHYFFIYEFCNGGTLEAQLRQRGRFKESEALGFFQEIVEAYKVLVKENIMHRDLKPANILLHNERIKLADFGFCKALNSAEDMTSTMVGSPVYMAPEILKGQTYGPKAEVWSLGCVLYELLFGECPFEENSIAKLITRLEENPKVDFPRYINNISADIEELLLRMLVKDAPGRISWEELFEHKLVSNGEKQLKKLDSNADISFQRQESLKTREPLNQNQFLEASFKKPKSNGFPGYGQPAIPHACRDFSYSQSAGGHHTKSVSTGGAHNLTAQKENITPTRNHQANGALNTLTAKTPQKFLSSNNAQVYMAEVPMNVSPFQGSAVEKGLQSAAKKESRAFKMLFNERNKIFYMYDILSRILEYAVIKEKYLFVAYTLLKIIKLRANDLRRNMIEAFDPTCFRQLRKLNENWKEITDTLEFKNFKSLLVRECDMVDKNFSLYENEIEDYRRTNPKFKVEEDFLIEINNKTSVVNAGKIFLQYSERVLEEGIKRFSGTDPEYMRKTLLHANELMECISIDTFFENFIDVSVEFKHQKYFEMIKKNKLDALQEMVMKKNEFLRKNLYL